MTSQILDVILHRGKQMALVGSNGEGLFDPTSHGLSPIAFSTACYRGFVVRYVVHKKRLHVSQLCIGLDANHDWYFSEFDHPTWPYRTVHEMLFRNGLLDETFDRSAALAKLRSRFSAMSSAQRSFDEIRSAVDACLTRPYR